MSQEFLWFSVLCVALFVVLVGSMVIYYACKQEINAALKRKYVRTSILPIVTPMATVEYSQVKQICLHNKDKVKTLKNAKVEDFDWIPCVITIASFGYTVFKAWYCCSDTHKGVLFRPREICHNFEFQHLFGFGHHCMGFTTKRIIEVEIQVTD